MFQEYNREGLKSGKGFKNLPKTIQTVSKEIYDNMEQKTRKDESKFYCLKNEVQWQQDIIHESHLDRMPSDDIYDRINTILGEIYEMDVDVTEDDIRERIYEIESDVYTSDLTAWLHSDNRNVYYLDNALENGVSDGFQALSYAQTCYIQEIASALVNAIQNYIESVE